MTCPQLQKGKKDVLLLTSWDGCEGHMRPLHTYPQDTGSVHDSCRHCASWGPSSQQPPNVWRPSRWLWEPGTAVPVTCSSCLPPLPCPAPLPSCLGDGACGLPLRASTRPPWKWARRLQPPLAPLSAFCWPGAASRSLAPTQEGWSIPPAPRVSWARWSTPGNQIPHPGRGCLLPTGWHGGALGVSSCVQSWR